MDSNFYNIQEFGCLNDGITDNSKKLQKLFDTCGDNVIVYFPQGTYLINEPISIHSSNILLYGDGSNTHIVFQYEQKDGQANSLFNFDEGVKDVEVKDMLLEYKGHFFGGAGESYSGIVSGLDFKQCFNVKISNMEIFGFNSCGISVSTGSPEKYAKNFSVNACYLHHNRVSGFAYGYVDGVLLTNSITEYNGSPLDGGTGYGSSGSSNELPRNIRIIGNQANFNYRKGIDLHAGINTIISGNICHGNGLYGIYAEGYKSGNTIITNNIVSGMNKDKTGFPKPYLWSIAISVGPFGNHLCDEDYYNFIIEGNMITDFGLLEQNAFPFHLYYNMKNGHIKIKNNILKVGRIAEILGTDNNLGEEENKQRNISIDISSNQIDADEITLNPINISHYNKLSFSQNQINVKKLSCQNFVTAINTGNASAILTGNQISTGLDCSNAPDFLINEQNSKVYSEGNFVD